VTDPSAASDRPPKPRPAPPPDPELDPYYAAAAEGRLIVQRCVACGHTQLYPRLHCIRCRSEVHWIDASGLATVYSFTVIRQHFQRPFREMVPYIVALVDLDEGPRLMTNLVEVEPDDVGVGLRVEARFEPVGENAGLVLFAPA
jgi:uncharacterized OB-fold protein